VSRIRKIRGTGRFFGVPEDFRIRDHLDKAFGIVRGDKTMKVRLLFSRNVAAYIRERVWHSSQKMVERRNGGLEVRFETAGWKELVRWVLSWQPDVKVLAPVKLKQRVLEKMKQGLKH
jgi:predicted DNA-binding transcriptional regulator YafY